LSGNSEATSIPTKFGAGMHLTTQSVRHAISGGFRVWKFIPYSFEKSKNGGKFFDPRPSNSFGCKIIIWIGARRIGKTFSAKKEILKKCVKDENFKFVWLRDNDEARKKLAQDNGAKFFSDCKKMNFQNLNGTISGETILGFGRTIGYLMPSSTFQNYKGNDYEDIQVICYDEFISEKGKAQRGNRSWEIINSLFTVASIRKNVKILMLANALDRGDPFLNFLGVKIRGFGLYVNREKDVCLHYCDNHPEFNKARNESVLGRLIKGTEFEANLFHNKFADDENLFYDKRPAKTKLFCILETDEGSTRLYYDNDLVLYTVRDYNTDAYKSLRFVSNIDLVTTKRTLAPQNIYDSLKKRASSGLVKFDNAYSKKIFSDFLKKV